MTARSVTIGAADPCLDGHFSGNPVVPGVVIIEEVLVEVSRHHPRQLFLRAVPWVKFVSPLRPGKQLSIDIDVSVHAMAGIGAGVGLGVATATIATTATASSSAAAPAAASAPIGKGADAGKREGGGTPKGVGNGVGTDTSTNADTDMKVGNYGVSFRCRAAGRLVAEGRMELVEASRP